LSLALLRLRLVQSFPHVDECRACKVCVPQSYVDSLLGNSSSSSSGSGGGWWQLLLPWAWDRQQQYMVRGQQQWQQAAAGGQHVLQRHLLSAGAQGAAGAACSGAIGSSDSSISSWLRRAAALWRQVRPQQRQAQHHRQQQRQRQRPRRRLLAGAGGLPLPPGARPPIDGVKTHKAWLARQAVGQTTNDTHAGVLRAGAAAMRLRAAVWPLALAALCSCSCGL
jgi:hypothetical protein